MSKLKRRLDRIQALEQKSTPPKIIVLWPGDPYPAEAELVGNVVIIRVVYGDRWPAD